MSLFVSSSISSVSLFASLSLCPFSLYICSWQYMICNSADFLATIYNFLNEYFVLHTQNVLSSSSVSLFVSSSIYSISSLYMLLAVYNIRLCSFTMTDRLSRPFIASYNSVYFLPQFTTFLNEFFVPLTPNVNGIC